MKNIVRISTIIIAVSAVIALAVLSTVHADSGTMDDAHADRIRANCLNAQSTLNRLHANDALLRANRGELYESIATKLMATLNSRIALNQLDGAKLSQITVAYNQTLDAFRSSYITYEEQLSSAMKIDCTKQPVAFYDAVNDARVKRNAVHANIVTLNNQISEYSAAFDDFNTAFMAASKEVSNK